MHGYCFWSQMCLAVVDFPYSTEVTGDVLNDVLPPNIQLKCVDFLKLQEEFFFSQERKHTHNPPKSVVYEYVNMLHHYFFPPRQ